MDSKSHRALIIVDVQNDFCEGGSLAVPDGSKIIPTINEIRKKFEVVVLTADWHPIDHVSFFSNHFDQKPFTTIEYNGSKQDLWPPHCVQNTEGAAFHKDLVVLESDIIIRKGVTCHVDAYSGFGHTGSETELHSKLQSLEINEVFIVGLAYDVCVLKTAFSALRFGYLVNIVEDATQALDKTAVPTKIEEEMKVLNQGNPDTFSERLKIIQSYQIQ